MAVTGRRPRAYKPETKYDMNMMKLIENFHSEERCRQRLAELRWPDGVKCPRCDGDKYTYDSKRYVYDCYSCSYQFTVISNTMLHDTHLPLNKWFIAVYMMCESKKGISANQLKRTLDVSYKTAWYLCHRIRTAMSQATDGEERVLMSGIIEMDETFVGGKTEGKGRGYKGNKALLVGVVQRRGEFVLQIALDRTRKTLHEIALRHISPEAEAIFTDEWPPTLASETMTPVMRRLTTPRMSMSGGNVHTNTVDGVWSLLKRAIIGAFHHVSVKHLDKYLSELEWRFGNRENPYLFRDTLLELLQSEHIEYRELTA